MELKAAITGRRSVRAYTDTAVDEQTIRELIDAAVYAPSAVNQQPWTFTVVRDQRLLDEFSREAKAHMLATLKDGPQAGHLRGLLSKPEFHIFYHAPALIVISANQPSGWNVEDCTLAAQNLMLTAYAAGLGTCWIGFAQSYLNTPAGKAMLGLPAEWVSVAPIIVGHPKTVFPAVPRNEPEIRWVG